MAAKCKHDWWCLMNRTCLRFMSFSAFAVRLVGSYRLIRVGGNMLSEEDFLNRCNSQLSVGPLADPVLVRKVQMRRMRYEMAHPYLRHVIRNDDQAGKNEVSLSPGFLHVFLFSSDIDKWLEHGCSFGQDQLCSGTSPKEHTEARPSGTFVAFPRLFGERQKDSMLGRRSNLIEPGLDLGQVATWHYMWFYFSEQSYLLSK